jgi:hypothetical protein
VQHTRPDPDLSRLAAGEVIEPTAFTALDGSVVAVSGPGRVRLQFRRFAGCPICSQHLGTFAARHGDVAAAGVTEVVVLHSAAEQLQGYQAELPFTVVADPDRVHYRRFRGGDRCVGDGRPAGVVGRGAQRREWLTHHSYPDGVGVGE